MKTPFVVPLLLLANKKDLEHRRVVGVEEGHEVALEFSCQFYEVSAADHFMHINIAYQALLRDTKITQQQRSTILRRRRSSLMTVSKKLGSIFGKKESDSEKKRLSCDTPDFALSFWSEALYYVYTFCFTLSAFFYLFCPLFSVFWTRILACISFINVLKGYTWFDACYKLQRTFVIISPEHQFHALKT